MTFITSIIELFNSIPATVWSGISASFFTLSGVIISNASNTKRLKLQLENDAKEKAKERIATLRRDVSLKFAEELVNANAHLASLPQLDSTKTNLSEGLKGFFSAAARLQLAAEPKTTLLVGQLSAEYGELVFKLMAHLLPVSKAKSDIQIADDLYNKASAEVTRVLGEMTKLNESGHQDQSIRQILDSSFQFHQNQAEEYATERNNSWTSFNQHSITFQKYLLSELRKISSKHIPVMVEIRRDLGLIGDLSAVEAQMQQQWSHIETHFDTLIAALETK